MIAGAAVVIVALVVAGIALLGSGSPPPTVKGPYIFTPGSSAKVVLGLPQGSEQGSQATSGIVLVDAMNGGWLINEEAGGVPSRPTRMTASGRRSRAATSTRTATPTSPSACPAATACRCSMPSTTTSPAASLTRTSSRSRPRWTVFGAALLARDFNHDGYVDLVVGAPGAVNQRKRFDHGSIQYCSATRRV